MHPEPGGDLPADPKKEVRHTQIDMILFSVRFSVPVPVQAQVQVQDGLFTIHFLLFSVQCFRHPAAFQRQPSQSVASLSSRVTSDPYHLINPSHFITPLSCDTPLLTTWASFSTSSALLARLHLTPSSPTERRNAPYAAGKRKGRGAEDFTQF